MRTFSLFLLIIFGIIQPSTGQATDDFHTIQSGSWNTLGIWERFNGSIWEPAVSTPSNMNGEITILHAVEIPTGIIITADQLVVEDQLTIQSNGQLNLVDGAGTDLIATNLNSLITVNGVLLRNNGSTINNSFSSARLLFEEGSEYRHNYTSAFGDLPIATWHVNSTILIQGFTNTTTLTAGVTWSQPIGNLIYNAPGQRGLVDFAGNLLTILGDFTILNTGNNAVQMSSAENPTISIGSELSEAGGNLSIAGSSRFILATTGTSTQLNIYGDFIITSTNGTGSYTTFTGSSTIDVYGDFMMNAGAGRLHVAGAGTTGESTFNFRGDFNFQSGRIDELGSNPAKGRFNFLGSGVQTFINKGLISGLFNYFISTTSILDATTYALVGSGSFTLEGTIILGSLETSGAIQSGTLRGNIRTPTRIFAEGSTIIYRSQQQQYMSSAHPSNAGVTTIIDNSDRVKLVTNVIINGNLQLDNGILDLNNYRLTSGGTLSVIDGTLAGSPLSSISIGGSSGGHWGTLAFDSQADTLGTLIINRIGTNSSVTLNGSLHIVSALSLTRGDLHNNGTLEMTDGALITRYNSSSIIGAGPSITSGHYDVTYRTFSTSAGPFADFTAGPELATSTGLGSVVIGTAQNNDIVRLNNDITVNGTFGLGRGVFLAQSYNITMNGLTWADNTGTFNPGTGTVIFNDTTEVGGSSAPLLGNITLTPSSSLVFTRSFTIRGNIDFAPGTTFNMENHVATLSGSTIQLISAEGATFSNINVVKSNSAGITLTSPMNLSGLLQFVSPSTNVNFNSNGFLTLMSITDAAGIGNASIYRLLSGNTVTGDVTVQRYMSGEGRIYRYLSSPVSNATVAQWKDDFSITGNFSDPSPRQRECGRYVDPAAPSLFYYDESLLGDVGQGYVGYPLPGNSSTTSALEVGQGYSAFLRQCSAPTVVDVTGTVNQGQISLPISYTVSDASIDGFNLVGNPYPATIDWDISGWTKTRISPIISIADNGSGFIRYYDPGVTNDIPDGRIAPGQAFWVRATGANPVLTIRENVKVNTNGEFFREAMPLVSSFALKLAQHDAYDKAYVKLHEDAKASLDDYDAPKIPNPSFSLSTLSSDNIDMAINAMDDLTCEQELRIGISGVELGTYTLSFETQGAFNASEFTLVDHFLNTETVLKEADIYSFEIKEEEGSKSFNRFSLKISQKLPALTVEKSAVLVCGDNQAAIVLNNSSKDVIYTLWDGDKKITENEGTGKNISLIVDAKNLVSEINKFTLSAQSICGSPVEQFVEIIKRTPVIDSIKVEKDCINEAVYFSASTNLSDASFQWYERQDDLQPFFVGNKFKTELLVKNKTYFVSASSEETGCLTPKVPIETGIKNIKQASIDVNGLMLISNFDKGNQWSYNGNKINTTPSIKMEDFGVYELHVSNDGCITSAKHEFVKEDLTFAEISIYPNPIEDQLFIRLHDDSVSKIEITSLQGVVLYTEAVDKAGQQQYLFNTNSLVSGVYLLTITRGTDKRTYRLIKK